MDINHVLQDFQRRWEKTFLWVQSPDSGEESLFYVDRITADASKIANMVLSSPEFGKIILNMGSAHTLKFKYPPVGVFQHEKEVHIFRRRPLKQYKHGLCNGNSYVYPVHTSIFRQSKDVPLTFELVASAYAGLCSTFKDSLVMLGSGRYKSVALKDGYSLMLSCTEAPDYILLYWDTPIARIKKNGDTALVIEKAFAQQIEPLKGK